MPNVLEQWIETRNSSVRWIEPAAYAAQVVAGGDETWPCRPQSAAQVLARANEALKSQVASLDILPVLTTGAPKPDPDDSVGAAEDALGAAAALDNARAVVRAVTGTLAGRFDVMLRLPSPLALLRRFGMPVDAVPALDDLDDAAVALAGVIRALAEFDLTGVVLATPVDEGLATDECGSLESIVGSVHHQRRIVALRLEGAATAVDFVDSDVDLMLCPNLAPVALVAAAGRPGVRMGGGLGTVFWAGGDFPSPTRGLLYYGDAPEGMAPEKILARLDSLRVD
ncbi:MAG: hypothetical protein EPN72_05060 [Nevskiaceae bacterium]|nr:MAG: hypothetical protein EPN72_05060 [Nevskiaceae bacterium]